jgi:hypothetical protein
MKDWIELRTEQLLKKAKLSGFFKDVISDAEEFEKQGFVWDVALAMSCEYWCN